MYIINNICNNYYIDRLYSLSNNPSNLNYKMHYKLILF